jgi:hypothetical protein
MKFVVAIAAVAAACLTTNAAAAQTAPAPVAAAPAAAVKFTLDTPIEQLVADEKAKAVLDADLPGITSHPAFDSFKAMSLRAVQPFSNGALTDDMLKKVETDLAQIK